MATSVLFIVLLIGGLFLFGFGLAYFIVGRILKNRRQWIPGAVAGLTAILIFVVCFVLGLSHLFRMADHKSRYDYSDDYNYNYHYDYDSGNDQEPIEYNAPETLKDSLAADSDEPVGGFIEDADKSLVFIRVFPDKQLGEKGIHLDKIDKTKPLPGKKVIIAGLTFDSDFRGWLQLELYSSDKVLLGSSMLEISRSSKGQMLVHFVFDREVSFLDVEYARLMMLEK